MNTAQVETLQYILRQAGPKLALDGHIGLLTVRAVRDLQRKNDFEVDDCAGPETTEALTS